MTPAEDRLAMVAAAVAEHDGLEASDLEIQAGRPVLHRRHAGGAGRGGPGRLAARRVGEGCRPGLPTWERVDVVRQSSGDRGRRSARGPCRAARGFPLAPGRDPAARGVEHRPPGPAGGRAPGRLPGPRRGRRVPARASPLSFTPMTTPRGRTGSPRSRRWWCCSVRRRSSPRDLRGTEATFRRAGLRRRAGGPGDRRAAAQARGLRLVRSDELNVIDAETDPNAPGSRRSSSPRRRSCSSSSIRRAPSRGPPC